MSKSVTIAALLVLGLLVFACERIETKKEKYPSGKLKSRYEVTISHAGEFKNGVCEEFYENGEVKSLVNYVDNREHGLYRSYFENGKPQAEIFYLEGLMHGDSKEWYDNGQKKRFARYMDGLLNGELQIWDEEGKTVSKATFQKGICKEGDCQNVPKEADIKVN